MRVLVVALIAACGSPPPKVMAPAPPPPPKPVRVEIAELACVDAAATRARLEGVLAAKHATHADLVIRVDGGVDGDATQLQLRVTRSSSGNVGLERSYTLGPADCGSSAELVALGVDRFLDAFPDWAGPPPPPPAPVIAKPRDRWVDVALIGAVNAMAAPLGVDGHVGGAIDHGARVHRFGGTVLVRASAPQAAGSGSFQQTALLAGAMYRFASGAWRLRVEARGGALLVSGIGLAENARDWLPWWEGAVFAGRGFSWGTVGIELSGSGLAHQAVTRDGLVSEDIPMVRLGVAGELGVWSQKP